MRVISLIQSLLHVLILLIFLEHVESSAKFTTQKKNVETKKVQTSTPMSFVNTTCHFFTQHLDHFATGAHSKKVGATLEQRYCVYEGYESKDNSLDPIFFYTGNESPVETYINHTGLMWNLAPKYNALLIFAEHRYEGQSLPTAIKYPTADFDGNFPNCMSYASSSQALADYAQLLSHLNPGNLRPVIVFGGSYGGMLSSWMRMKYPSSVAGALASSAPIWATPLTRPRFDSANVAISRGILLSDEEARNQNHFKQNRVDKEGMEDKGGHCFDNLLASWPLIVQFSKTMYGRSILNKAFRLCPSDHLRRRKDVDKLLEWAQSPWFSMAEGNYPFESNYITFALLHSEEIKLPKWPITEACKRGGLNLFHNIQILHNSEEKEEKEEHDDDDVQFDVVVMDDKEKDIMRLNIDWDEISLEPKSLFLNRYLLHTATRAVEPLFEALREAVGVWFNVTKDKQCFSLDLAVSRENVNQTESNLLFDKSVPFTDFQSSRRRMTQTSNPHQVQDQNNGSQENLTCSEKITVEGSWSSVCCNENLNLPIYIARGMGGDFFWPPTYPRGTILPDVLKNEYGEYCSDPSGIFGYPKYWDAWSQWIDDYYGGLRIGKHSKIMFSNGLLDPWSGGGVYPGNAPSKGLYDGPIKLNVTKDDSIVSLIITKGAHHLDLFFESEDDPECVKEVRAIEEQYIRKWISEWNDEICVGEVCEVR